jgi:hypothetical protein
MGPTCCGRLLSREGRWNPGGRPACAHQRAPVSLSLILLNSMAPDQPPLDETMRWRRALPTGSGWHRSARSLYSSGQRDMRYRDGDASVVRHAGAGTTALPRKQPPGRRDRCRRRPVAGGGRRWHRRHWPVRTSPGMSDSSSAGPAPVRDGVTALLDDRACRRRRSLCSTWAISGIERWIAMTAARWLDRGRHVGRRPFAQCRGLQSEQAPGRLSSAASSPRGAPAPSPVGPPTTGG